MRRQSDCPMGRRHSPRSRCHLCDTMFLQRGWRTKSDRCNRLPAGGSVLQTEGQGTESCQPRSARRDILTGQKQLRFSCRRWRSGPLLGLQAIAALRMLAEERPKSARSVLRLHVNDRPRTVLIFRRPEPDCHFQVRNRPRRHLNSFRSSARTI